MMKTLGRGCTKGMLLPACAIIVASICFGAPTSVFGQPSGCTLIPDERNPSDKILRCGDGLTIRTSPNTRFSVTGPDGGRPPTGIHLDAGALLIDFTPSAQRQNFQILTPHAIAAVRGTQWAVEVVRDRTSTLVISGAVEVKRPSQNGGTLLQPGRGADVFAGRGRIVVGRWAKSRVDALMARFRQ